MIEKKNPEQGKKRFWVDLGTLNKKVVQKIKDATGIDLDGYRHTVDDAAVGHIFRAHGPGRETRSGQEPITKEDIALIQKVVESPDKVRQGTPTRGVQLQTIIFQKRIDGHLFYVASIRTGKKELAAYTMWKVRIA